MPRAPFPRRARISVSMVQAYRDAIHELAIAAQISDGDAARQLIQYAIREAEAGRFELDSHRIYPIPTDSAPAR